MNEFDINEALEATVGVTYTSRRAKHPDGLEFEWDGRSGFIQTGPLSERPRSWDAFIRDAGLDPAEVEVVEPVQVRGWDAMGKLGPQRMHYYKLVLRSKALRVDLEELIKAARGRRKAPLQQQVADHGFVIALGDLQLGKIDGDGVEGTVTRFVEATTKAVQRYQQLKRRLGAMPIFLVHLGDCIEGFQSQGGANTWRTVLTVTEQVRLYRRLLIEQIKILSALTPRLVMCAIPGNHDDATRPIQRFNDSWAIESAAAVKDALELAGTYEHVTVLAPGLDELTLTLDMCGTVVGMAHGHQWRKGQATTWWAKQSHGRQPIGDADLLLSAHLHHLRIEDTGPKTWIQVPALESESTWWRHRAGEVSRPGVVTMVVGGGRWTNLEVL